MMKAVACAAFFILHSSLLTSCNSFLTDEPQSQITPEEAYNSVKNLKLNALLTVYNYIGGHEQSQGLQGTDRGVYDLNSFTTDEQIVPTRGGDWFDGGLWSRLFFHTWSAGEAPLKNTWDYLFKVVILCNEGIEHINAYKTTNVEEQEELESYKAELRAVRAMFYFYLMDLYANPPFLTKLSSEKAPQIQRADLFTFLESELKDIIGEGSGDEILADAKTVDYGRADKAAGMLLLARMYLNAEVYTGTARWADAKKYADMTISTSYKLCTEPKNGFSAYQLLFMGDNDTNGAQDEIILPALHDGEKTQTWGGSLFMIAAPVAETMKQEDLYGVTDVNGDPILGYGTSESWDIGLRARKEFSKVFFGKNASNNSVTKGAPKDIVPAVGDDRAIFYTSTQDLSIQKEDNKNQGLIYMKFNNLHSDGTAGHHTGGQFVDTDYPMLRLAEAYLISAECDARENNGTCTDNGVARIKTLRQRANVKTGNKYDGIGADALASVTLEDIFQEWSREFGFEGMRRMVLIRWNRFAGQSDYKWEWMGGTQAGVQFDSRFNIFPIPDSELNANPNIKPNYN